MKGCEDMVDSSFKTAHEQFLPAVESPTWSTDNRADESSTKAPDTPQADVAEGSDAKPGALLPQASFMRRHGVA